MKTTPVMVTPILALMSLACFATMSNSARACEGVDHAKASSAETGSCKGSHEAGACGADGNAASAKGAAAAPENAMAAAHHQASLQVVDATRVEMAITGKKLCGSCEKKISASVGSVEGVARVSFDRKRGVAIIEMKEGAQADLPTLVAAVKKAGFDARQAN